MVGDVDQQAIALIEELCILVEGVHTIAYKDPVNGDGLPITNGVGATRNRAGALWNEGDRISEAEARWLLHRNVEAAYWPCATIPHWEDMDAYQRAALADLNFNEGYTYGDGDHDSLDYALLNKDWLEDVGRALQLYDNNDSLGLSRRRYAEWLIFSQKMGPKEAYFTAWSKNSVAEIMEAIA
jgi:GH24 family phage-related lysozyme (muramidase)